MTTWMRTFLLSDGEIYLCVTSPYTLGSKLLTWNIYTCSSGCNVLQICLTSLYTTSQTVCAFVSLQNVFIFWIKMFLSECIRSFKVKSHWKVQGRTWTWIGITEMDPVSWLEFTKRKLVNGKRNPDEPSGHPGCLACHNVF